MLLVLSLPKSNQNVEKIKGNVCMQIEMKIPGSIDSSTYHLPKYHIANLCSDRMSFNEQQS